VMRRWTRTRRGKAQCALPGYSRPLIRAEHYLELVEHHTFRGDRVRPIRSNGG
jgi:hypothetical protein